jgi:hypothetical protein
MSVSERFVPEIGLVIYKSDEGSSVYIEEHQIKNGKFGPGKPIGIDKVETFVKSSTDEKNAYAFGILPKSVIAIKSFKNSTSIAWISDKPKREMVFNIEMGILSGTYSMPRLLFIHHMDETTIYALPKEKKGEDVLNLPLYKAPIGNNRITFCYGEAEPEKTKNIPDQIRNIENAVFEESQFTHFGNEIFKKHSNLHIEKYLDQSIEFDVSELNPILRNKKSCLVTHILTPIFIQ